MIPNLVFTRESKLLIHFCLKICIERGMIVFLTPSSVINLLQITMYVLDLRQKPKLNITHANTCLLARAHVSALA